MSVALFSTPNLLCFFRIAVIPFMVALYYWDSAFAAWTNAVLITLAGASDFFDGRIARATGQTSVMGKFLDYTADKLVVGAALVMLVGIGRITGPWIILVVIILLRELLVSGMREFMALYAVNVQVSRLGKWKLAVQMVAIGFVSVGEYGTGVLAHNVLIGKLVLLAAAILTVVSGWAYVAEGLRTMKRLDAGQKP